MLSYRHGFHAGNYADILKHFVLSELISYQLTKDSPLYFIDTHAGSGWYNLNSEFAQKNREFTNGLLPLINVYFNNKCPAELQPFIKLILASNNLVEKNNEITKVAPVINIYPGSAGIANAMLRSNDKLILCELHPSEYELLNNNFIEIGDAPKTRKRVQIRAEDGFIALKALLPPPSKRGLILIDPPYEVKSDYDKVIHALSDAQTRFATGTYAIWYPLIARKEAEKFYDELHNLGIARWLQVELLISAPINYGRGMYGSGMFIINPHWTLPKTLKAVMPWLTKTLAQSNFAKFHLDFNIP